MTNEQKKRLLLDLIKIEEDGEIFNFTRAERAEFQKWIDGLIDQEPKTGHWIPKIDFDDTRFGYYCSECGIWVKDKSYYCPNCGAKMIEPQESEDKE